MSEFDEEAERERLREKYERDEAEREVTQQMSELLLRGATMTNKHCETCSNPIFRYEGQEFCAVCNGQAQGQQAESAQAGTQGTDAGSETADTADATAGTPSVNSTDGEQSAPSQSADADQSAVDATKAADEAVAETAVDRTRRPARGGGDVATARESLVATLVDLSARAETAEDLDRQRDLLAAAREAAEAVEATDRVSR